ncbi:MAG: hypothetical protein ACHREM_22160 [Polyangiales bacterium]
MRLLGMAYVVDETHTRTIGAMAALAVNWWWGVYGFGLGSGLGYASFSPNASGGWNDDSLSLAVWAAPVQLAFGRSPRLEFSLNAGAIRFFSHQVEPWGALEFGIVF